MSARYRIAPVLEAQLEARIQLRPGLTLLALAIPATHSTPACPSPKVTSNATAVRAIIPPGGRSVRFATPGQ